jgi:hypothetical protein
MMLDTEMSQPLSFLYVFRDLLRDAGIRFAITSGMACVYYGLQQTTKDSDWIVDPADLERLREVLEARQRSVPSWRIGYRTVFGAPLHAEWMAHGWTSHILVQDQALGLEHHLDFFGRPPRVVTWAADADGFADREVVAMMKRTDRERDWPIVDGLGWQLAEPGSGPGLSLVHVQDAQRLQDLWGRASAQERAVAAARRPMLLKIEADPDPDHLEGWIRLERLVWQCANRERHGRYQHAWKEFYRRWRLEPEWQWPTGESFERQHPRVVDAAHRHGLPPDPLAGIDPAQLLQVAIARAAAIGLTSVDRVQSVAPPLQQVLP